MNDFNIWLITIMVFLPTAGALLLALMPARSEHIKQVSLLFTALTFVVTILVAGRFDLSNSEMQMVFRFPWIKSFNIEYYMGIDGISLPLVILTSFLSMLSMLASWKITPNIKGYCILFLLLETGMLGVFVSLDFFLFYVFWEVMLLPMYFLIGIWGGGRREYSALKFFLYTLLGSVLILVAMLMFFYASDATLLGPETIAKLGIPENVKHTFDILALQQLGQLESGSPFGSNLQLIAFVLLFIGFAIKVPVFPFHTWLPDAHVDAPTPISMILAGVLLKMGGYGIIRIAYPICPEGAYYFAAPLALLGVWSILYGAFAAMAQTDFKRLVAYSSVSHMGYVLLGIAAWGATADGWTPETWKMGMNGAMFQMIAHGISSAGMFFIVGVAYDRVHHRDLNQFGGLAARLPVYSGLAFGIFFAGLGLPGLCGFIGEVFVVLGAYGYSKLFGILAAAAVILTAGYILWTIQRVFLGAEYRGPHGDNLYPLEVREIACAVPLLILAVVLGVYPDALLMYMQPSVDLLVDNLAEFSERATQLVAEK